MTRISTLLLASAALLVAGCGGDDDVNSGSGSGYGGGTAAQSGEADSEKATSEEQAPGTTIKVGTSQYGQVLFGPKDGAIYYFDKEQGSSGECYAACAEAWPPVLTEGKPQAGPSVKQSLLGTSKRDDGTTQVTYGGHPLYYYVDDPPGEVLCHNVVEFGGLWLAVDPSGDPVS